MHPASDRLKHLIQDSNEIDIDLPLIHITDAYSFANILLPKRLVPQFCEVFEEHLTYFFYGRPAYRTKHKGSNYLSANLPIVMIFHPGLIEEKVKRIYPFDTGAFKLGIYQDFFHKASELERFELGSSISIAKKIVAYLYRDAKEYYHGGTRKNVEIPAMNFEAEGLFELARLSAGSQRDGTFTPDFRCSSIEVQIDTIIDIKSALLGIILPEIYLDEEHVGTFLKEVNPKHTKFYNSLHNIGNESLSGMLFEIVNKIYRDEGIIQ